MSAGRGVTMDPGGLSLEVRMSGQDGADERVPDPQGRLAGLPYDFRRPETGGPGRRVGGKLPT
jgi:hypothetical protein